MRAVSLAWERHGDEGLIPLKNENLGHAAAKPPNSADTLAESEGVLEWLVKERVLVAGA